MKALLEYYVSRVLLEKMTVTRPVSKGPTLYQTITYTEVYIFKNQLCLH